MEAAVTVEALGPGIRWAEIRGVPDLVRIRPGERGLVGVGRNRLQSVLARDCARACLSELGRDADVDIPRGHRGLPVLPPGVVGSLTHTDGLAAAAFASAEDCSALGVDAEPNRPIGFPVRGFATPSECDAAATVAITTPDVAVDRLLFSAKEAAFKAFGDLRTLLEVEVELAPEGRFRARAPERCWRSGSWHIREGFVVTVLWVPPVAESRISRAPSQPDAVSVAWR